MPLTLDDFALKNKKLIQSEQRIVLAYSGGLDSSVLLFLLSHTFASNRLLIWHVNHQLQHCAHEMAEFCRHQAEQLQLPFVLSCLDLSHLKSNIESQARSARYEEFERGLNVDSDVLLTAHHADDQIETLMLNMCRGTGVLGLRGIADDRLINSLPCNRPLLNYSRDDLKSFAKTYKIDWFDDPSNAHTHFDRNYLRHKIIPSLKGRWPSVSQSFTQVAAHQKEAAQCLQELAILDLETVAKSHQYSLRKTLVLSEIKKLSFARQKNLLRYWLGLYSSTISLRQLDELMGLLSRYHQEFKKIECRAYFLGLFKGELFLVLHNDIVDKSTVLNWLEQQADSYVCRYNYQSKSVSSHYLKHQFQTQQIPPWLRDQTLFKVDDEKSKHKPKTVVL